MIHIVLGTKAQLIKMAPIMAVLQNENTPFNYIFTSQHKEKIDDILSNFSIKSPDYVLYKGQKDVTSIFQMMKWFFSCLWEGYFKRNLIFKNDKNGIVLVHGDTFSTFLGALLGRLVGLKVGHVESGLRSFNLFHPFPEEITRLFVFKLSHYFFCPGNWAVKNLRKQKGEKIDTGNNTLLDSLQMAIKLPDRKSPPYPEKKFGLVSLHRYENIFNKQRLKLCLNLLDKVSKKFPLLFVLHLPTKNKLIHYKFFDELDSNPNIEFRPRYDYFDFISLLQKSSFLITDGGSNQEECFYLGHPCLLFRMATEREEGLGENALLSNYEEQKVDQFFSNLQNFNKPAVFEHSDSPSRQIIDFCGPWK